MRRVWKFFYTAFAKPIIKRRLRKKNFFSYAGLDIVVHPGVFHPGYFFSTIFFAEYIYELDLKGKTFCEAGVGSGMISLIAYRYGGEIHSFDISEAALENTRENFALNFNPLTPSKFNLYKSDLFDEMPDKKMDYVFINPPYFFKEALTDEQKAWNCGKDGQYFKKLFYQLPEYTHDNSDVFLLLADNCDIKRIKELAKKFNYEMHLIHKKKIKWEWNFLFRLDKI